MANFSSDDISPGYIELVATTKRKTKEDIRTDQLIPQQILENSEGIDKLLKAYYTFMNMEEFIYQENKSFDDVILDNRATFRVPDPENKNNAFFTDETGAESVLRIFLLDGTILDYPLTEQNVAITNGNELPGSLVLSTSEVGKTFTVTGLEAYNNLRCELTTIVKYWVGPGPSYVLNTIEEALDIDSTSANYLELIQKEIAAVIPRDITVDKRNLYKNIVDFYKVRGSTDSIEIFFRLLFNDSVEVTYPYNETLIPSSGAWDINPSLPKGGQYLDNKGFLSDRIKIQDSLRYQKFSYLIRTGKNVIDWEAIYNRLVHPAGFIFFGEILILIELTKRVLGGELTLSAMPFRQPGTIGLEDFPILVEMFASVFSPTLYPKIHRSAALSATLTSGVLTEVDFRERGWGYSSAPAITFNGIAIEGQTPVNPVLNLIMGEFGEIDEVQIVSGGSGWQQLFINVAANPNATSIADVFVLGTANKIYKTAPTIVFSQPSASDAEGNPLPSNQIAQAQFTLDSEGEINGITITNPGSGYIFEPVAHVNSGSSNEYRAKDIEPILILPLNHKPDLSRTIEENDYYTLKQKPELQFLHLNYKIEDFADNTIEDTQFRIINKNNVNSFIHID
jgi:hypothetical protein